MHHVSWEAFENSLYFDLQISPFVFNSYILALRISSTAGIMNNIKYYSIDINISNYLQVLDENEDVEFDGLQTWHEFWGFCSPDA